jgi:hypothetical protein
LGFVAAVLPINGELNPPVVISQVQSGFVEIFNLSAQTVSIDGWSIQTKDGSYYWSLIALKGQLAPGQHFLIGGSGLVEPDSAGVCAIVHSGAAASISEVASLWFVALCS